MLGTSIDDDVESGRGHVEGLGLLPVHTTFGADKVLSRPSATLADATVVEGYEIHHGTVRRQGGDEFFVDEGCRLGSVAGTSWHGLFENDEFRRSFLTDVASRMNRGFVVAPDCRFADIRETRFERLADMVADHLDTDALEQVIEGKTEKYPPLRIASS